MMIEPTTQERRASERYHAYQYTAYIKRHGWLGKVGFRKEAAVLDFNRHGIGLCCDQKYKVGERLNLSIQSATERVSDVQAVVCYMRRQRGESILGLQFLEEERLDPVPCSAPKSVLAGMEQVILRQLA